MGESLRGLTVEPATCEFAALVLAVTVEAFREFRERLDPPSGVFSESIAEVETQISSGGAAIAWLNDVPVGAVRYMPEGDHLYAGRLAVLPAYRRNGIGEALMRFVEHEAVVRGLVVTQVEVRSALPRNVEFFERLGYRQLWVRPHPRDPVNTTVRLEKRLG